jgi:hypothetical protein
MKVLWKNLKDRGAENKPFAPDQSPPHGVLRREATMSMADLAANVMFNMQGALSQ